MAAYMFVAGSGCGGFIWKEVAAHLKERGHDVFTPTLTGLGERIHLASPHIDLELHLQDIIGVLEYEDLHNIILVGHSYGGMVITGVAERVPHRLAHLVYLDALVPQNGQSALDIIGPALRARIEKRVHTQGDGWLIPPPTGSPAKIVGHPFKPFTLSLTVTNPAAARLPHTFIYCTKTHSEELDIVAARVRTEGWHYYEIEADHMAMVTAPKEVARVLIEIAQAPSISLEMANADFHSAS